MKLCAMEYLYLGTLLCVPYYTFALLFKILQFAILTFIYAMILLLSVVWKKADCCSSHDRALSHRHTRSGPLQKCNLGQALFQPNAEIQSK